MLYTAGLNIFVAFFVLLLLLADITPPAASSIPRIGNTCQYFSIAPRGGTVDHSRALGACLAPFSKDCAELRSLEDVAQR